MLTLSLLAARAHRHELAQQARPSGAMTPTTPITRVTLRYAARPMPAACVTWPGSDSAAPPGTVLVAEVDGRLRAALPLDGAAPIADPFHRGTELLELLRVRAGQLARG